MAYATEQDVTDLYGDDYKLVSVDRDHDGDADQPPLTVALASATSEINSYIAKAYTLPIPNTATGSLALLKTACIDIAIYRLSSDRTVLTDEKIERYKRWMAWLKDVAKGDAILPDVDEDGDPTTGPTPVKMTSEPRLFSRTKLGGLF